MRWCRFNNRWHALAGDRTTACEVTFTKDPSFVVAPEGEFPPSPCRSCLMVLAMADVEEESLDAAKARGLEKGEPMAVDAED